MGSAVGKGNRLPQQFEKTRDRPGTLLFTVPDPTLQEIHEVTHCIHTDNRPEMDG